MSDWFGWHFHSPWAFALLLLAPLVGYLAGRGRGRAQVRFSSVREIAAVGASWRTRLAFLPAMLRVAGVVLLVVALARPQEGSAHARVSTKGVILELVIDRSGSMEEEMAYRGQRLTRLEVVKRVVKDFVAGGAGLEGRSSDLLGLVTFARYANTVCPLVRAHDALLGFVDELETVTDREENYTAIGEGLALGVARLEKAAEDVAERNAALLASAGAGDEVLPEFQVQSKAIVLLTDGRNNAGEYLPMEAAEYARAKGITVYTVGIGGTAAGGRRDPFFGMMRGRSTLDEGLLQRIAETTGGFYGRADSAEGLREVFARIDELETSEIESVAYSSYDERFGPLARGALLILGLEILLSCTWFRRVP